MTVARSLISHRMSIQKLEALQLTPDSSRADPSHSPVQQASPVEVRDGIFVVEESAPVPEMD